MDKALEYCARSIIRYLDGDVETFKKYINKAMEHDTDICRCGDRKISCKFEGREAQLCTRCGRIIADGSVIRKCLINSRRAS